MKKRELAVLLSKLKTFSKPKVNLEQYQTDSEIAADALWTAYMCGDIEGKTIVDLGCGTGTFGLGALLLGAKKVYMIELDEETLALANQNKETLEKETGQKLNAELLKQDIRNFKKRSDVVIQNPPFGVQKSHTDKLFLLKAMETAPKIYSFHKIESNEFIKRFAKEHGFCSELIKEYDLPIKKVYFFHAKRMYKVKVGMWHIWKPKP
ncbi:methyltransferase [Candidatus Woesearchaeota archaeon]|nr:methyltransferase [Candidatus Woesearchaeota archaeon]